jgi:hypothetical protein
LQTIAARLDPVEITKLERLRQVLLWAQSELSLLQGLEVDTVRAIEDLALVHPADIRIRRSRLAWDSLLLLSPQPVLANISRIETTPEERSWEEAEAVPVAVAGILWTGLSSNRIHAAEVDIWIQSIATLSLLRLAQAPQL